MAKIRISESELRQIIRESVENVLSERINYGTKWETLSEPEKKAAAEKYYKNAIFHPSMGGLTYTYPDGTTGTSAYKYDQATGQQLQGTANYNMDAAKDIYNRKRNRKQKNGNLTYSADQFNQAQKNSEEQINTLKSQLDQAANLKNTVDQLNARIQELESQNSTLTTQNAALQKQVSMYKPAYEQQMANFKERGQSLAQAGKAVALNSNAGIIKQNPIPPVGPTPQQTGRPVSQAPETQLAQK